MELLALTLLIGCASQRVQADVIGSRSASDSSLASCPQVDGDFPVYFPHETDCSLFYRCYQGDPVLLSCPAGLYFDPSISDCNWPSQVQCNVRPTEEPVTTSKPTEEPVTTYKPTEEPDSCEKRLCSSTDGCSLVRNTLLTVLPQLNKEFFVSFEFRAEEYIQGHWPWTYGWQSVIHFTEGGNCCEVGQRVPAFWVSNQGQLHPSFAVDGNWNYNTLTDKKYSLFEWHSVQFSQSLKNGKYMYRVEIDGETVLGPVENKRPESFSNVKVYAADPWTDSLKGSIRNVIINTDSSNGCHGGKKAQKGRPSQE